MLSGSSLGESERRFKRAQVGGETERSDANGVLAPDFCSHTILVDDGRHRRFPLELDFVTALERALVTCGGAYSHILV